MKFQVKAFDSFKKQLKQLLKKYRNLNVDIERLTDIVEINPTLGESLGGGFYKIRLKISDKNKGKSGGARIITYVYFENEIVYFVAIYDKSEAETLDLQEIRRIFELNFN